MNEMHTLEHAISHNQIILAPVGIDNFSTQTILVNGIGAIADSRHGHLHILPWPHRGSPSFDLFHDMTRSTNTSNMLNTKLSVSTKTRPFLHHFWGCQLWNIFEFWAENICFPPSSSISSTGTGATIGTATWSSFRPPPAIDVWCESQPKGRRSKMVCFGRFRYV